MLTSEEGVFYGFPEYGQPGMKLGGPHGARAPIDPNDPDRTPCPAHVEALRSCLARYLPGAAGEALMLRGCIYTVTPDEHFIIDRLPQSPNVIVASPCSGHGYKFATVIGEILADLATGGTTPTTFPCSRSIACRRALQRVDLLIGVSSSHIYCPIMQSCHG